MATTKEFTVHLEDQPGTLAKLSRALADRGVNIIAFQSFPTEGKSTVRLVVDNPTAAKTVLDSQKTTYTEDQVAQTNLPHRPGELARVATKLGEAKINIDYAYTGIEPGTNTPMLIVGVKDVSKAARLLDEVAAQAA
jgi:hypothetical protein